MFNRIYHMLDKRSHTAYFNGLVLPHLDYVDIVWGDQQGFTTRSAKNMVKANVTSAEALTSFCWAPLHARRVVSHKMLWREKSLNISMCSVLQRAKNTFIIPLMVTCPKSAGLERNSVEPKRIVKQLTIAPYCRMSSRDWCQKRFLNLNWNRFYWTILISS